MTVADRFSEHPDDTREAIMKATYLALCEHGYADLTIERIAREFPKSKSLLYHHYDSKDALLLDFLDYLLALVPEGLAPADVDDPNDQLQAVIDYALGRGDVVDDQFHAAISELRAQAVSDERYRERFTEADAEFQRRLERILRRGVEAGVFRDVDAEAVAVALHTTLLGGLTRRATTTDEDFDAVESQLQAYLDEFVRAD